MEGVFSVVICMRRPYRGGSVGVGISSLLCFQSVLCFVVKTNITRAGTSQCQLNLDLVCCILPETDEVSVNAMFLVSLFPNNIQDVSLHMFLSSCCNFTKRAIKHFLICWSYFGSIQTSVFFTK